MIIYENTKGGFVHDVRDGHIAQKIQREFDRHSIGRNNDAEFRAWSNSLLYMRNVLDDGEISDDVKLAIEFQVPLTSKRVDFLIAGKDGNNTNNGFFKLYGGLFSICLTYVKCIGIILCRGDLVEYAAYP